MGSTTFYTRYLHSVQLCNWCKWQVGSICILASLDGFFEYMELSPNSNEWPNKGRSSSLSPPVLKGNRSIEGKDTRKLAQMQAEVAGCFEGLDTMLGIVDARYIQHCCPLLMVRHFLGRSSLCGVFILVLKIGFVTVDEALGKRAWTSGHYMNTFNEIDLAYIVLEIQ